MKKRILLILLSLLLALSALTGCGNKKEAVKPAAATEKAESSKIGVTIANASGFIFNELYVSPTAANEWGDDHLGSTNILKSNGSFDITLERYSYDNYDIKIIDEEGDTYEFTRVPMTDGTTVTISFDNGLVATATGKDGTESAVTGTLNGETGGDSAENTSADYTTEDFSFTVYNGSDFAISCIYMMPAYTDGEGEDMLTDGLAAGDSFYCEGSVVGTDYEGITDWTLRVVDIDGDESVSYDVFNPWLIDNVNIVWGDGGYVCQFS